MITINYINGLKTDKMFGYKRYQEELHSRIRGVKLNRIEYEEKNKKNVFAKAKNYLYDYPKLINKKLKKENIIHITNQNLAYLIPLLKLKNTILSCYDLIGYHRINDYDPFNKLLIKMNYASIKCADRIITISEHSKKDLIKTLGIDKNKITVIYPCVDKKKFYPEQDEEMEEKYEKIKKKILLYVGSEEPRQNIDKIIRSLYLIRIKYAGILFIKVGEPHWKGAREKLNKLVKKLQMKYNVLFLDHVSDEELRKLYTLADVFIYPCSNAGWGLPPMEALSCGTPSIVAEKTALQESVNEGAIYVNPKNNI